ncbi:MULTISPECIES: non-ribosomal peptide synthetase [unclassified Streptomyces]|uniref:non-ribosomal peptide synthetase n=1 Tax=unclassified Streptomyces TaxID=2593676 RepID=UPI000DB9849F|nr:MULTISPECIES: non-ribosomal peptide synthetase [unclassified Streptomyces]MYT75238.1 amino acid adenylation domain-containing protein [Streptomyces sp. SID8367]RAJ77194.1 pristinamycin I synthase-3/4 [Streptomyces sp. PsTaAH-137]
MTVAPQIPTATLPLTAAQKGLLVVHRTVPVPHLYNVVAELELDPGLTPAALAPALIDVLAVQPALRLAIREGADPHAVLGDVPSDAPLHHVTTEAAEFDRRRTELLAELGDTAFDLTRAPLLRAVLLRAADGTRSTLLLVVHHLVFDGFSLRRFVGDLTASVQGTLDVATVRAGRERALGRELEAQLKAADDDGTERAAKALADRLRATPATVLNPRPNRPATTDFTGTRREIRLSPRQSADLDGLCATLGVSPFVLFSAAYAAVLARHSANTTVVFGSPVMARRTLGSFDLCGFFVNTLPLIVDVSWDTPFDVFAKETVQAEAGRARADAAVSFDRIVRHVDPDRSTNRNPVFSCMLALQDATDAEPGSPVRRVREHGNGTAKFDLWLGVTPGPEGWSLELESDRELLPEPLADALAASLRTVLDRAVEQPGRTVADLFEDTSAEDSHATDGFRRRLPQADLYGAVRAAAAARPGQVAVQEDGRRLTYAELDRLATTGAAALAARGVTRGTVVGLTTTTLVDTVVTVLAVLARGAVFLPLDLGLPAERLTYMTGKADCRLVVGDDPVDGVDLLTPAELTAGPQDMTSDESAPTGASDGVYIMFTSGSTGRPKGVLMNSGPLMNLTEWQLDALDMDERTRFLQYAPLGFDVSFQEILPTLVAGGTLVSREPADRRDLPAVVERVRAHRVTHVYLPVAALPAFVRAAQDSGDALPHLSHVCVSGEQLLLDDRVRSFFADRPHLSLVNLYGPTETHAVTTHRLTADHRPWPSHVPIGRPITDVAAHVVDTTGHLAPRGVPGELYLAGACPALGYVNDPARTDERFLPDPYAEDARARMYRTGDQVLRDESGALLFLGRDDDQVKIRGYRVELGELESAAASHPDVARAVGVVHGEGHERRLALFFRPEDGRSPDPDGIRTHVAAALPGYMVPARVFPLDAVPTTRNGKVDRAALAARAQRALADEARSAPAVTTTDDPLVAALQQMWAKLLGIAEVPVDRSLLEHGAHSLTVMAAGARIEEEYGVQIPILDFFRDPTVRAQAAWITTLREDA